MTPIVPLLARSSATSLQPTVRDAPPADAVVILPVAEGREASVRLVRAVLVGLLAVEVVLAVYCQWFVWQRDPLLAVVNGAVGPTFIATSLVLAGERGQSGNVLLFSATSLAWSLGGLPARDVTGTLLFLGWLAGPCFVAFSSWAVLRYPDRRLGSAVERWFVAVLMVWSLLWGGSMMAVTASAHVPLAVLATTVFSVGGAALGAVYLVLLARRFRRLVGLDRRTLAPITVVAAATSVLVAAEMAVRVLSPALLTPVLVLQGAGLLLLPVAFLLAATRRELARAAVADLVLGVNRPPTAQSLETGLRAALRDPDIRVLYYLPERRLYVDSGGVPQSAVAPAGRVAVPVLTADGQPLAVVVVEAELHRYAPLLEAALAACGLSLEVAQLQASLQARLEELRASRARIVEAGLAERRRLERDLHDGVQHRLIVATMSLAAVSGTVSDETARDQLHQVRDELRGVLADLRDLAHGIHPAVLTNFGLREALQDLVRRWPLPVSLDVPDDRWSADVESTVYFVSCEALANAVKHSQAGRARLAVRSDGHDLVLEVSDDGVGGADPDRSGLSGLRDRVLALDGSFEVLSPAGGGTCVLARLPLDRRPTSPSLTPAASATPVAGVRPPAQRAG